MSEPYNDEDEIDYAARFDAQLWRRMLVHALPYRKPLAGLILSGLFVAICDVSLPRFTGRIIDAATTPGGGDSLFRNALGYATAVIVLSSVVLLFIVLAGRVATGIAHDVRRAAFAHLQELSFSYYDKRPVGWLMARLTSDTQRLASIIPWFLLDMVWGVCFVVGITIMMLVIQWKLALLVMTVLPPLLFVSVVFQRRLLRSQRLVRKTNSRITASFNEGIMGVRTSKALVRESQNLSEFRELSGAMFGHSVRNQLQSAVFLPIVLSLGSVAVGLALWRGGLGAAHNGMTLGDLVAFMQYAALMYMPVQELAERFTQLQVAQASAERLQQLLDTEPEIRDSEEVVAAMAAEAAAARQLGLTSAERAAQGVAIDGGSQRIQRIDFEAVDFEYVAGEPVLRDFSLTVLAGESIALVGATGSGKSTVASLVSRFYEPTAGCIAFDGVDYRRRSLSWLQSSLGIVLQTPHLFSGSIRDNIRYGRLEASDAEIEAAAQLVDAHSFIAELEKGYDTEVGENGNRLSTGQRQFVSLARAVLSDPQIFIMDEATSSLDTETERLIQRGIERLVTGRISFIIAHRLSTVRSADRILVIERGRIAEQGSHSELLELGGRYQRLYRNQFSKQSARRILQERGVASNQQGSGLSTGAGMMGIPVDGSGFNET